MNPVDAAADPVERPQPTKGSRGLTTRVLLGLATAMCLVVIYGPFTVESVGGASMLLMLLLVFCKVPIGVALFLPAVAGLHALYGTDAVMNLFTRLPYEAVATWEFSVIPMFVFMGLLLWRSGVTEQLYRAAGPTVGRLPGGLAVGTNTVGIGLAAVSGATIGIVHALARIGIPEMLRAGYHKHLAVGSVVVAGLPGQIIPPSVFLIIYAGIAEVPVGPQLIAGLVPGSLLGLSFCVTVVALVLTRKSTIDPANVPVAVRSEDQEAATGYSTVARGLAAAAPLFVLMVIVLGGMFSGLFTATEAGGAGAFGALLLTVLRTKGHDRLQAVGRAGRATLTSVGTIFFLLIGAQALARLIAVSGIGTGLAEWVGSLDVGRVSFLLILMVAYLVLGMFMDPLSIMLLTVPLLLPVTETLGISPLWFGVFVVLLAEMAIVTPPVGVLAFIVHDIVKDPEVNLGLEITLGDVFRAIAIFIPAVVLICLVLIGVPDLATWLPSRM